MRNHLQHPRQIQTTKSNRRLAHRDNLAVVHEMFDDDVGVSGGDKGLVVLEVAGEGFAAGSIEFAKNIVEK